MSDQKPDAKFGEPWSISIKGVVYSFGMRAYLTYEQKARACDCVNALSGISDPGAFVVSVRELVEASRSERGFGRMNEALARVESHLAAKEPQL